MGSAVALAAGSGLALAVLALDQWTKALIQRSLGPSGDAATVAIVGDWFLLEYARNRGVAFGVFAGHPELVPLVALVVLAGLVGYAARRGFEGPWLIAGAGLVVGGAVGNLIDRIRFGYVIDFLAIGPWPNFNVADSAIAVGVVCLAVDAMLRPDEPRAETGRTVDG